MEYITIRNQAVEEFEEKKSTFIGHAKRVNSEEEAKAFVNEIKLKHREARHNVFAYIIGENQGIQRYSDDGEPQGTGGIPVLEVIKKNKITDVAVVVTRYFGGILLGAGGLTRAYTKGASLAIKAAGVVYKVHGHKIKIEIEYDILGKLQYAAEQKAWFIDSIDYNEKVMITLVAEKQKCDEIITEIMDITHGKVKITKEEENIYFREGNSFYSEI